MKKVLLAVSLVLLLSGCEYIPSKVYEVETIDGQVLKFSCPKVDQGRSTFTYLIDTQCILVN